MPEMLHEINQNLTPHQKPKKRVLFVITQSEFGGAQRFLYSVLARLNHDHYELFAAVGSDGDSSLIIELERLGLSVVLIPALKRNPSIFSDLASVGQLRRLIKKVNPSTLFLNSSKAGFVGALAASFCNPRPKVVYRIGGWTFNDPWPTWKKQFYIILEKISARWKDIIIVNNTHDLEQAVALGIHPRKHTLLIHNGIDPYKLDLLPRQEAREKLKLPLHAKVVGIIANFYPAKGLEYLIEAAELVGNQNTIFCIIGAGHEYNKIQKLVIDNKLDHKIILAGRLDRAYQYLSAFDVFVLSSVKEGFPWSVLEAMSAKVPVVATRVGAIPELIEDGVGGFIVPPRDAAALAEKIAFLLTNDIAAGNMAIAAHQRILTSFSFNTMMSRIEELL